ncbi:MAG: RNA pseudouridine synthase [Puniceicoccales bacterium]|jgi:23S rRNA-/tRNA-specific pseudouridylate synthase|nr:RNA pseudouridine synthase [Puniceicoccales bacterium]
MSDFFNGSLHPKAYIADFDANRVVALYKPCEVTSIPTEQLLTRSQNLLRLPYDFQRRYYVFPEGQKFFLLNRLDAPTSGLLIGCFDKNIATAIRQCFFNQEVRKIYYALTAYRKMPSHGTFLDCLSEQRDRNHLRISRGLGEKAMTKYFIEKELCLKENPLLKLHLQPITGRTHQLRVQCALRKLPIIGDKIYGDFALNRKLWAVLPKKRLYLQSCAIAFSYEIQGEKFLFSSQIPCEF